MTSSTTSAGHLEDRPDLEGHPHLRRLLVGTRAGARLRACHLVADRAVTAPAAPGGVLQGEVAEHGVGSPRGVFDLDREDDLNQLGSGQGADHVAVPDLAHVGPDGQVSAVVETGQLVGHSLDHDPLLPDQRVVDGRLTESQNRLGLPGPDRRSEQHRSERQDPPGHPAARRGGPRSGRSSRHPGGRVARLQRTGPRRLIRPDRGRRAALGRSRRTPEARSPPAASPRESRRTGSRRPRFRGR